MKNLKKTVTLLFLVLTLCLSVCPIGVQASTLSGDMVDNYELNDIAYSNSAGTRIYQVEAGNITCKVNVLNNSAENKTLMLISAVYDTSGTIPTMKAAGIGKATINSKTRAELSATVTVDSATNRKIKTFVWDTANRTPYKEVATLTADSNKKFDKAYLYIARVLSTGTENPKKGYQGIVDEHKGTITFEVPYSKADAVKIQDTTQMKYSGFYFSGAEDTAITWDRDTAFTPWVPLVDETTGEDYRNKYNNLASGRTVYKAEFSSTPEVDISTTRPTFTFTAKDGSTVSYKVNIFFVVVDDDFENTSTDSSTGGVTSTSKKTYVDPNTQEVVDYATWEWYWKPTLNDATGFAGVKSDTDGNSYMTVYKGSNVSNVKNSIQICASSAKTALRDTDGTLIPLHNNGGALTNANVMVEYDWRYRPVTVDGEEHCDFAGSYIFLRNNSNSEYIKAEGMTDKRRKWNGGSQETVTYDSNTWYHDRIVMVGVNNSKVTTPNDAYSCRIYPEEFYFSGQTTFNTVTTAKEVRLNDICIRTGGVDEYFSTLDLDNLKIGLLFE